MSVSEPVIETLLCCVAAAAEGPGEEAWCRGAGRQGSETTHLLPGHHPAFISSVLLRAITCGNLKAVHRLLSTAGRAFPEFDPHPYKKAIAA